MREATNAVFFANICMLIIGAVFANVTFLDMSVGGMFSVFLVRMICTENTKLEKSGD